MAPVTIPHNLARQGDLVLISKKDYEEFLNLRKIIRFVKPTKSELSAISMGREEVREGKYKFWSQIKHGLADSSH